MGTMGARVRHYYDVSSRRLVYVRLVTQPWNAAHAPCLDCLSDSVARFSINNTMYTRARTRLYRLIHKYAYAPRMDEFAFTINSKIGKNNALVVDISFIGN